MEPGGSKAKSQRASNEPNQPSSCIDTYFLKVLSNIVHPSTPKPSKSIFREEYSIVKIYLIHIIISVVIIYCNLKLYISQNITL